MLRFVPVLIAALAMAGVAMAEPPKAPTLHAQLKSGRSIEVRDPDIINGDYSIHWLEKYLASLGH